jgi:hypothetical protein
MMDAARTSETSVDIQLRTWQYIPEDSELQEDLAYLLFTSSSPERLAFSSAYLYKDEQALPGDLRIRK